MNFCVHISHILSHTSHLHRHIATVFERLGYDSTLGQQMFSTLAAAARKRRGASPAFSPMQQGLCEMDQHEKGELESSSSMPHQALFEDSEEEESNEEEEKQRSEGEAFIPASMPSCTPSSSKGSPNQSLYGNPLSNVKMDLEDFVIAAEIDDVFIQIILLRNRLNLSNLFLQHENEEKKEKSAILEKELTLALGGAPRYIHLLISFTKTNIIFTNKYHENITSLQYPEYPLLVP